MLTRSRAAIVMIGVCLLISTLTAVPVSAAVPTSCSVVDTGTGFDVSWDQTAADAVIVYRSVDGGSQNWRGKVDAPGLTFPDGALPNGAVAATYEIKHQIGGVNGTAIPCTVATVGVPTSCSVVDTGTGFDVSWDQTAADAVIVYRSVDGGSQNWRGKVDAPGLTFPDGALPNGAVAATYEIKHQIGGVNGTAIPCTTDPVQTATECTYFPSVGGVSLEIFPDFGALAATLDTQVIQRSIDGGAWTDEVALPIDALGAGLDIPPSAQTSIDYRVQGREANGTIVTIDDCQLLPYPIGDVPTDNAGNPAPMQMSQQEAVMYNSTGPEGSGNDCDIPPGYYVWDWNQRFSMVFPNTEAVLRLALWLPHAPDGYHYQVRVDVDVSRTGGPTTWWANGELGYAVAIADALGRFETANGALHPSAQTGTVTEWGDKLDNGSVWADGGYMRLRVSNNRDQAMRVATLGEDAAGFAIHLIPDGQNPENIAMEAFPQVEPPPNPCLAFYGPDEPGLGYPQADILPQTDGLGWAELAGITWEALVWINDVGVQFLPGYDCVDAVMNGANWGNVTFCILDLVPVVGSLDEALRFADEAADFSMSIRQGDNVFGDIFNANPVDDIVGLCRRSFGPDTQVRLADGTSTPISTIEIGETVLSYEVDTDEYVVSEVLGIDPHTDDLHKLDFGNATVWTTEDHPFYDAAARTWVEPQDFDGQTELLGLDQQRYEPGQLRGPPTTGAAYDIHVADTHNYFVSDGTGDYALVHNSGCIKFDGPDFDDLDAASPLFARDGIDPNASEWGDLVGANSGGPFVGPDLNRYTAATVDMGTHADLIAANNVANPSALPKGVPTDGGVYILTYTNPQTGLTEVFRTGRSSNLNGPSGREAAHIDTYGPNGLQYADLQFRIIAYTDDYNQQMGLERLLYDAYPGARSGNGQNLNQPVGPNHPFWDYFREYGSRIVETW